ncbi:MAG: YabN family protein, partial [Sphingopyxis sp.]
VYHAQLAAEIGAFTLDDVVRSICEKMVRRHPHVYGAASARNADEQRIAWDAIKAAERDAKHEDANNEEAREAENLAAKPAATAGALAGVAIALPALMRAQKLQKRAARVGFDWPDSDGPRAKISEELAECDGAVGADEQHHEIGDLLFSVVNLARHQGLDAETALRDANARFETRFAAMEDLAGAGLPGQTLAQMETLWLAAKRRESGRIMPD